MEIGHVFWRGDKCNKEWEWKPQGSKEKRGITEDNVEKYIEEESGTTWRQANNSRQQERMRVFVETLFSTGLNDHRHTLTPSVYRDIRLFHEVFAIIYKRITLIKIMKNVHINIGVETVCFQDTTSQRFRSHLCSEG